MMFGTIELAEHEVVQLKQIDFNQLSHESLQRSCEASAKLMPLLLQRKATPAQRLRLRLRLRYFDDPEFNGGKKSRMQVFEGNGTSGVAIFGHGNFLPHLRYFIHGAALPEHIKVEMTTLVGDPSNFTGGDLEPICKLARQLARSLGVGASSAGKFFQLMYDIGLSPNDADSVRRAVLSVR